jgi:hypothetical protein
MARFTAVVDVAAPVVRVWDALVDWPAHARWVPLTRIRVLTPSPAGVGARFVAKTGIGPLAFDDVMEITEWQPPGEDDAGLCRVVKQGRVVLGSAWLEVSALDGARTRVAWTEDIEIAPVRLTRPFAGLIRWAGRPAFTRALRAMAADVGAGAAGAR